MSYTRQVLPKPPELGGDRINIKDQLALLERQLDSLKAENNGLKRTLETAGLSYEAQSDDRRKRPKFNNVHCDQCRKDKKGCWPRDRAWPQKCTRCIEKGLECSEGQKTPSKKTHLPIDSPAPVASGSFGAPAAEGSLASNIAAEAIRLAAKMERSADIDNTDIAKGEVDLWKRRVNIALDLHEACMTFGTLLLLFAARADKHDMIERLVEAGVHKEAGLLAHDLRRYLAREELEMNHSTKEVWLATMSQKITDRHGNFLTICQKDCMESMEWVLRRTLWNLDDDGEANCVSRTTPLMNAVECQSLEATIVLLREGADPNTVRSRKPSELASDAWEGSLSVLASLNAMSNVDALEEAYGDSMLRLAMTQSHERITVRLSSIDGRGSDSNDESNILKDDKTSCGRRDCGWHANDAQTTPLLYAVDHGYGAIVEALVGRGCNVDEESQGGIGPLHLAAKRNHCAIAAMLLDANANIDKASSSGLTPLGYAARHGHFDMAESLLIRGALTCLHNGREQCKWESAVKSPLVVAAQNGHTKIVQLIRAQLRGGCVGGANSCGGIALCRAAGNGSTDTVRLMIEASVHLRVGNHDDDDIFFLDPKMIRMNITGVPLGGSRHIPAMDRALLLAVEQGHESVAKLLIDAGADTELRDENYLSLLEIASHNGNGDGVELLLRHASDTCDALDASRALLLATQYNHPDVIRILLKAGVNIEQRDEDGLMALAVAAREGHRNVLDMLLRHSPILNDGPESALLLAVCNGNTAIVETLIWHGASLQAKDEHSRGLLLIAIEGRHAVIFEMLVQYGLSMNPDDSCESTKFLALIHSGEADWVLRCLQAGANPRLTWHGKHEDRTGDEEISLLQYAVSESWHAIVKYLLHLKIPSGGFGEGSFLRSAFSQRQYPIASLLMNRVSEELHAELELETLSLTTPDRWYTLQLEMSAYVVWLMALLSSNASTLPVSGTYSLKNLHVKFYFPIRALKAYMSVHNNRFARPKNAGA